MIKMTPEKALEELREVSVALVTKTQVSGYSRKEALEIVANGYQLLIEELKGRANGTISDYQD